MRIAIDGGALQHGISAGIFNVFRGLTNALFDLDKSNDFYLVVDPRLGKVRKDLLDLLDYKPKIIEARVGPTYRSWPKHLLTDDPLVIAVVDGISYPLEKIKNGFFYSGPAPRQSFYIKTRSERPSDLGVSADNRKLGISVERIVIAGDQISATIEHIDPRLTNGFYGSEGRLRWTDGYAEIPLDLFPLGETELTLTIITSAAIKYRVLNSELDKYLNASTAKLEEVALRVEMAQLEARLIKENIAIFISNHFLPLYIPGIRNAAVLYDLIPLLYPNYFMPDARKNFEHNISVFKKCDHIFSISETSRRDIINQIGIAENKVSTMYIDVSDEFTRQDFTEIEPVLQKYHLGSRPFIICVGTLEPRKNQTNVVLAFDRLTKNFKFDLDLVFVGKHGWYYSDVFNVVSESGLQNRIHFLTSVSNKDLACLYSRAFFSIYPSFYEGFGLPVIEAMACGCPVITSDRSSTLEISGDSAVFVDPTDIGSISKAMLKLSSDFDLRSDLSQSGIKHRKRFSWKTSAKVVADYIGNI